MARFALRRLVEMVVVLFLISILVFLIFNVIPGSDPAPRIAGKNATPQLIAQVEETWGFDESLPVQYWTMMKLFFSGELVSYSSQLNVVEEIWKGLPATMSLCVGAALLAFVFGAVVGYLSAGGRRSRRTALGAISLVSLSLPVFLPAALFLHYLGYELELFPSSGYVGLSESPLDWAHHLVLPWVTLALIFIGLYARVLRAGMLDTMQEDYVRTARAKGLSERRVQVRHVLRNALLPMVSISALDFAAMVGGGAIVTEYIFSLQGVGQFAADAVTNLDLPPVMGVTLFAAFFVVVVNALVDIAYTRLDPRITLSRVAE